MQARIFYSTSIFFVKLAPITPLSSEYHGVGNFPTLLLLRLDIYIGMRVFITIWIERWEKVPIVIFSQMSDIRVVAC